MNNTTTPTTTHRVLFFGIGYAGSLDDGSTNEPDDHDYAVKLQGAPRRRAARQRSVGVWFALPVTRLQMLT
jgi:hypothetical protein